MQARPTTEQILNDLAREVRDTLIPGCDDPAMVPNLQMMEQLLTAAAVRSAHEIAWMNDEGAAAVGLARDVVATTGDEGTRFRAVLPVNGITEQETAAAA